MKNASDPGLASKIWKIVDALPQRDLIETADARRWIAEVIALCPDLAVWHAIRLQGFGGSEIGVLVRNFAGVRADHQASAHDLVEGKLMRRVPSESSGHLRRGNENEAAHAARFYQKYGAVRDERAYQALKSARGRLPWMRYSPDDLALMPLQMVAAAGGWAPQPCKGLRLWLIDYKAPSVVEEGEEIAFQYACQLHLGAILSAETGIDLEGMMLSQYDWANWSLKDDACVWDEDLGRAVIESGTHYWETYVLRGQVPPYVRTPDLDGVEAYRSTFGLAAQTYASLHALAGAAANRADQVRALMVEPVAKRRFAGAKLSFGEGPRPLLTISATQMLDQEAARSVLPPDSIARCTSGTDYDGNAMAARLRELGEDPAAFDRKKLNASKVYAEAISLGLDPQALVSEQLTFKVGPRLREQMASYIDEHYPLSAVLNSIAPDLQEADGAFEEALPAAPMQASHG